MSTALATTRDAVSLDFRGAKIRRDGDFVHATDMWKAAGADPSKEPSRWRKLPQTIELLAAAAIGSESPDCEIRTNRGRPDLGGGSWFGRRIAVAYAAYLSAPFHLFMIDSFLALTEPRPNDTIKIAAPAIDLDALADKVELERLRRMVPDLAEQARCAQTQNSVLHELGLKACAMSEHSAFMSRGWKRLAIGMRNSLVVAQAAMLAERARADRAEMQRACWALSELFGSEEFAEAIFRARVCALCVCGHIRGVHVCGCNGCIRDGSHCTAFVAREEE